MNNRYINALINKLDLAIIFFDNDTNLLFYNQLFANLWHMDFDFLDNTPNIVETFEVMREKRIYPEKDNFRDFCNILLNLLRKRDNKEQVQNIMLPDGRMFIERIIRVNEGLIVYWEDNTQSLTLTHSLNNHKNIYQRLVDKNPYAVTVIASNGVIENYNGKFLEHMNISASSLEDNTHIKDLIKQITSNQEEASFITGSLLSGRNFSYSFKNNENETLNIHGICLPNANMFCIWQKNYSNIPNQVDTLELENNLEKIQNSFILELNQIIASPLTAIMGFAEMLQNEYVGNLNLRQKEYLDKIIEKSDSINQELNHKLELINLQNEKNISIEEVDISMVIASLLLNAKAKLKNKNISINLNITEKIKLVLSNENLLIKALSLILFYIIEQNQVQSSVSIEVFEKNNKITLIFSDSSKLPLFSDHDVAHRYDIKLALNILEKLNVSINKEYKNKAFRKLFIDIAITI
jgi:hypothetical protein